MTNTPNRPDLDLNAIEQRAAAATKGPWGFYDGSNYATLAADLTMSSSSSYSYRQRVACLEDEDHWDDPAHEDHDEAQAHAQMAANAAFIAAARTDVPEMASEIRRLRAELAPFEALVLQQCPKGIHPDWLIDSEYAHACPWCLLDDLRERSEHHQSGKQRWRDRAEKAETQIAATRAKTLATEADEIVAHCPDHGPAEQPTAWMACHCPVADDMRRRAAGVVVPAASEDTGR